MPTMFRTKVRRSKIVSYLPLLVEKETTKEQGCFNYDALGFPSF